MGTIYQNGILYSGSTGQSYSDMGGATSTTAGVHGLVPAPSAGDQAKVLKGDGTWKSVNYSEVADTPTLGTAAAKNFTTSVTSGSSDLVTSGAVHTAIDNLPNPMVFKGTLGTNGTITSLPTAGSANEGFTYKVITAATYSGTAAKVGDVFVSNGSAWILIPAGDDVEDSWRNIKVNGTEKLGTAISSGAVDFVNGTNTTVSFDTTGNKVSVSATDEKVTQTSLNDDNPYEILLSGTADNTTRTEGANKSNRAIFNPMNVSLTFGSRQSGDTEGYYSFAFGNEISATGYYALAEGSGTSVVGEGSHAEGMNTTAFGSASHAEGSNTSATGNYSHSEGTGTIAAGTSQHVFGKYNISDRDYAEIVGNGTADNARSNARTLDWSGNEILAGSLSLAGASSDITLSGTGNTWDGTNTSLKDSLANTKPTKTATGNPIEISDGANAPLVKCVTAITGSQDLHGYDKPWVGGAGKNKFQNTAVTTTISGVTFTVNSDGTVSTNGAAEATLTFDLGTFNAVGGTTYILNGCPQGGSTTTFLLSFAGIGFDDGSGYTYTPTVDTTVTVRISVYYANNMNGKVFKPMIRLASVADSTFTPYSNICPITAYTEGTVTVADDDTDPTVTTTHTTTYPFAIYRGSEDVVEGEVGYDMTVVDLGDLNWFYDSTVNSMVATVSNAKLPLSNDVAINAVCSISPVIPASQRATTGIRLYMFVSAPDIYIRDSGYTSASDFKTAMTGQQLAYELATPTTSSVTPTNLPVKSLSGYSHIESSTGDMEIEYITEGEQAIVDLIERSVQHSFDTKVYGIHISGSESDPSAKVTYLADAVGMTPAHMNFTTGEFDYGSWGDTFIIKGIRPCILQPYLYDSGTSMYKTRLIGYLNPNNYDQTLNGDPITWGSIDNMYPGYSVMIEFPKIWYKVVPDASGDGASIYFSNHKVDAGYKDYAYIDYQGEHKEHFYMSAYNGCLNDGKLRSNSGEAVMKNYTAAQEIAYAQANNAPGWYIEDAGEIMLINFLLFLIGKSTDTQAVFGQGLNSGGTEAINDNFRTGIHNAKGLFYGTNSGTIADGSYGNAVKVFGMENYWGFQWRRYAGDILLNGTRLSKLCWGTEDGSTTNSFNLTGDGYVNIGATPSGTSGSYISAMKFTSNGMYSSVSIGTSTTHYCDGQWYNNSITAVALRGGRSYDGAPVGASCVNLYTVAGARYWHIGAAPSFK